MWTWGCGLKLARGTSNPAFDVSKQKTDIQRTRDRQLAEWLRLGLAKTGVEKQDLAKELGLHPSAISHMLRGAREFKEAEILVISRVIKEPPPPLSDTEAAGTRVEHVRSIGWANPSVVVAPNVWRQAGAAMSLPERIPLSPDPRLTGSDQYVCKIEGVARYAVCVHFNDFRSSPRPGDRVHVVRAKGDLEEHTLHRVTQVTNGKPHLAPLDGSGPEFPIEATQNLRGLVVGFYSPEDVDI